MPKSDKKNEEKPLSEDKKKPTKLEQGENEQIQKEEETVEDKFKTIEEKLK